MLDQTVGIGGHHGEGILFHFKQDTGKNGFLFVIGSSKGNEAHHVCKVPTFHQAVVPVIHFLYIREFHLFPGGEFGKIGTALKGNQVFMVSLFHHHVSCRHHADSGLQLRCCNDSFFFYVCRTGRFDTDGVIIGLNEDISSGSRNENAVICIGCDFCLGSPLDTVQGTDKVRFVEDDFHGSSL